MKTLENGKIILEQGEKAYDAVLLEVARVQGVSKEKNKAYDFVKVRLDIQCVSPSTAEIITRNAELLADSSDYDYLSKFEVYQPCQAVFVLGYDPTSKNCAKFVGLLKK